LDQLLRSIAEKKAELDRQRARAPAGLRSFEHAQDLELTYASNAIEGNTLTARETALVIETGITIGGKPLKDHLEAIDHFGALQYVRQLARETRPISEADLRNLHRLVMLRSDPDHGGQYATGIRYVNTDAGRHFFPIPAEIPARMGDFAKWLAIAPMTPESAFQAHRELVSIHPFEDGNGRAGRLLMNLVLIRGGYPPVAVRPQDRPAYLDALQQADQGQTAAFERLLYERLDATLSEYVSAAKAALSSPTLPRV
jgi:Fic family protein